MYTIIETPLYSRLVADILTQDEQNEFITFIAQNPSIGDVIPHTNGSRKIRWSYQQKGKRGGARIIYFNQLEMGKIHLLLIYLKSKTENIPPYILKALQQELEQC
ncbi:transcriptional regulator [Pasteurellaceae bacterium Pebbles2]|nr:transcriptional regulator [Pasteurellaceae bacterium Pebbles2]